MGAAEQPDTSYPRTHPGGPTGNDSPMGPIDHGVRGLLSLTSAPPTEGPFVCLTIDQFRGLEARALARECQTMGPSSSTSQTGPTAELPGDDGGYDPDDEEPLPRQRRTQSFSQSRVHVSSFFNCTFGTTNLLSVLIGHTP